MFQLLIFIIFIFYLFLSLLYLFFPQFKMASKFRLNILKKEEEVKEKEGKQ